MNTRYDMPDNYYFGGGSDNSVITPFALAVLVIALFPHFLAPSKASDRPSIGGMPIDPVWNKPCRFWIALPHASASPTCGLGTVRRAERTGITKAQPHR